MRIRIVLVLAVVLAGCSGDSRAEDLTGEALAGDLGCLGCHTETDTGVAPTWNGLWGSEVELEDGTTVVADAEYVRRSIVDPQADIVDGYGPIMPLIPIGEDEVEELVKHIETLK